jgi:hypothetical protein
MTSMYCWFSAQLGDLRGDLSEALLFLKAEEESHRDQGGQDDAEVGEDLAKAANRHVEGNDLPKE